MMFRKLYWITEQCGQDKAWRATGAYTSISDLIDKGIRFVDEDSSKSSLRITLVKLDCKKDVLGSWTGPEFEGMEEDLNLYVQTHEFTVDEIGSLRTALTEFCSVAR